jgi:hypothetical protein
VVNCVNSGTESTITAAIYWPIVLILCDKWWCMWSNYWNEWVTGKTDVFGENLPQYLSVHQQVPLDLTRPRTGTTALASRLLTAWATARPRLSLSLLGVTRRMTPRADGSTAAPSIHNLCSHYQHFFLSPVRSLAYFSLRGWYSCSIALTRAIPWGRGDQEGQSQQLTTPSSSWSCLPFGSKYNLIHVWCMSVHAFSC